MLELNQKCRTKKGEVVTPFLIQQNNVYCINKYGSTVIKNIKDFVIDERKKVPKVVSVVPISADIVKEESTEELVKEEVVDEIVPEEVVDEIVPEEKDEELVTPISKDKVNTKKDFYPEDDDYI